MKFASDIRDVSARLQNRVSVLKSERIEVISSEQKRSHYNAYLSVYILPLTTQLVHSFKHMVVLFVAINQIFLLYYTNLLNSIINYIYFSKT